MNSNPATLAILLFWAFVRGSFFCVWHELIKHFICIEHVLSFYFYMLLNLMSPSIRISFRYRILQILNVKKIAYDKNILNKSLFDINRNHQLFVLKILLAFLSSLEASFLYKFAQNMHEW